MKLAIALLFCALSCLLGAQSAVAGGCAKGKGNCVTTTLVPAPVVEEKPLPPEKKCRVVKWMGTSIDGGIQVFTPAQFIPPSCCCGGSGTFIQGVDVRVPAVPTTVIHQKVVCE